MTGALNKVVIFIAGAAIGSAVTWKCLKTKYERIAQEEIDSYREVISKRYGNRDTTSDEEAASIIEDGSSSETVDIREYAAKIQKARYTSYSSPDAKTSITFEDGGYKAPYVIAPEDFDELGDYEVMNLTHYADGVLADMDGNIIEDVEDAVGSDYASHFGDYEDDAVHIRNERLKIDYEILVDLQNYSDVFNTRPHSTEDE